MADHTHIEWTDATWNPVRGCSRVSAGCQHCYAERVAARFSGAGQPYEGLIHPKTKGWKGVVKLVPEALQIPWRWSRPRRIFVNSMSDLFHPEVPFEYIAAVFYIMAHTTRHTYQVLTKRPERMLEFFRWALNRQPSWSDEAPEDWDNSWVQMDSDYGRSCMGDTISEVGGQHPAVAALGWTPHREGASRGGYDNCGPGWPYFNIWLGVSVEDQAAANERIPLLLQTPASVRWVSAEPLLGPVDLTKVYGVPHNAPFNAVKNIDGGSVRCVDHAPGYCLADCPGRWPSLDWVVAGGESGTGARPMHPDWARSLRDQCAAAGVPFLFKQWGEWQEGSAGTAATAAVLDDGRVLHDWTLPAMAAADREKRVPTCRPTVMARVGKKAAGRRLDGVLHDAYPEKIYDF